jgi:hypothetical protein
MVRHTRDIGPRLEALLDERDHLRIKISVAEDDHCEEVVVMRRRLFELDREIPKLWGDPNRTLPHSS